MDVERVRIVLHRPSSAENVGQVARAMKNFGLARLTIVAPPSWEGPAREGHGLARENVLSRARKTARKAADVLDAAPIVRTLPAALAGVTWACGTTSRAPEGRARLVPRTLGPEAAARAAAGEIAIVFGEERRGLSDAELEHCQAVCTIPTSAAYDSMNLAQAAAVVCYELAAARDGGAPLAGPAAGPPARSETVEALWERLRAVLGRAGYLNPQNPEHILADFRRLLARAEPTQREAELLVAAVRSVERLLR
jgi:tRNA/rRNA methyltransferase